MAIAAVFNIKIHTTTVNRIYKKNKDVPFDNIKSYVSNCN